MKKGARRVPRLAVGLAVCAIAALAFGGVARAGDTVVASWVVNPNNAIVQLPLGAPGYNTTQVAQDFSPSATGTLSHIDLMIANDWAWGSPGPTEVELVNAPGYYPTGSVITSTVIPGNALPSLYFPPPFYSVTFPDPVTLNAGSIYAFVIIPLVPPASGTTLSAEPPPTRPSLPTWQWNPATYSWDYVYTHGDVDFRVWEAASTPQTISFTPPASGTYGGSDTLTASGGGSGNPVTFSVDPSSGAGVCTVSGANGATVSYTGVGNCVLDANQAGGTGYDPAPQVEGTIPVGPATLTVTADDVTRLFGAANPPLTATLSGFVLGQDLASSGVSGAASCTTTATASSPGGSYPIICTQGSLSAGNYAFQFAPGTLTVAYSSPCLTGRHTGKLVVSAGQAICLGAGSTVSGPVTVQAGGALDVEGAKVTGPVASDGAAAFRMCSSTLTGPLSVLDSTATVVVGGVAPCGGNSITGPVRLIGNRDGVVFDGNTVTGPVAISGTTGIVDASGNQVTGPFRVD